MSAYRTKRCSECDGLAEMPDNYEICMDCWERLGEPEMPACYTF